jgi:predicted nucleic-acid-binding Zn-ribbon protein
MKNTSQCPKCSNTEILTITADTGQMGNLITTGIFSHVKVTRYLCSKCGFSEEWINSRDDIKKLKKKFK